MVSRSMVAGSRRHAEQDASAGKGKISWLACACEIGPADASNVSSALSKLLPR